MRFAVALCSLTLTGLGCAQQGLWTATPRTAANATPPVIEGVWDGLSHETISEGMAAGDTRIEKQEWHLQQRGATIQGYYVADLTYVSGDGRPYVCSRQPRFSTQIRFEVTGQATRPDRIVLTEVAEHPGDSRCDAGRRQLASYRAEMQGDVLTLVAGSRRQTLYRDMNRRPGLADALASAAVTGTEPAETTSSGLPTVPAAAPVVAMTEPTAQLTREGPSLSGPGAPVSASPTDVSGIWVWEHRGVAPSGDEKQEREEWHVDQDGDRITGYYDRVLRQISTDGQAYRCSMNTEFEIATRYRIRGEVHGDRVLIFENSFEVLAPSSCDNGQRRLDAYEGVAAGDEMRLQWGVGGQVLRRPRPDVPTQRF